MFEMIKISFCRICFWYANQKVAIHIDKIVQKKISEERIDRLENIINEKMPIFAI